MTAKRQGKSCIKAHCKGKAWRDDLCRHCFGVKHGFICVEESSSTKALVAEIEGLKAELEAVKTAAPGAVVFNENLVADKLGVPVEESRGHVLTMLDLIESGQISAGDLETSMVTDSKAKYAESLVYYCLEEISKHLYIHSAARLFLSNSSMLQRIAAEILDGSKKSHLSLKEIRRRAQGLDSIEDDCYAKKNRDLRSGAIQGKEDARQPMGAATERHGGDGNSATYLGDWRCGDLPTR